MAPKMRQMDPFTLDSRLMLRLNKDLWDVYTVQECMSESAKGAATDDDIEFPNETVLGKHGREDLVESEYDEEDDGYLSH